MEAMHPGNGAGRVGQSPPRAGCGATQSRSRSTRRWRAASRDASSTRHPTDGMALARLVALYGSAPPPFAIPAIATPSAVAAPAVATPVASATLASAVCQRMCRSQQTCLDQSGSSPKHTAFADSEALLHGCPSSDPRAITECNSAAENCPGSDACVVANNASHDQPSNVCSRLHDDPPEHQLGSRRRP